MTGRSFSASTVPILQLALSSPKMGEQALFDTGQNLIRPALASVAGTSIPSPYGGKAACSFGNSAFTPEMIESVEAEPLFSTLIRTERRPSTRTSLRCGG